ncbi:MAG: ABC transporter permease [Spirochaetales bacterium]|nr:ABC transporter permease [Spirochaetales bacterium]
MRLVLEKREAHSYKMTVLVPIISVGVSLLIGAFVLLFSHVNPLATYVYMFIGAFGSWSAFTETLVKAIPLMLTGLGVSVAFRLRFWNIGAEGQYVWGAIGTAWVMLYWNFIPNPMLLPVGLLIGMAAGAGWAGIPAVLKAVWKVDETLTTLMLNYVAILFAEFLYYGPWRDPEGYGFPGTKPFPEEAWLPRFSGRAHWGLLLAVVAAVILWFVLSRTKWGFEIQMIGKSPKAARCQGVNIKRNIILVIMLSGALSGLAGFAEVAAVSHRLQKGIATGYGYTAIIIAWMSQLNPIAALFVALLMAGLLVGGDQIQMMMGLPAAMGVVLQGLLLFPLLAGSIFTDYHLRIIRNKGGDA